jgi:hypothetical protein
MRYSLIFSILLIALGACTERKTGSTRADLPDSIAINDVISSIIRIDSLWTHCNINSRIKPLKLYKKEYLNGMQIPPEPFSVSYDELFSFFDSKNDLNLRTVDSIYVTQQVDYYTKYNLSDSITTLFNKNDDSFYEFYLPIFSHDNSIVYVFYARECGPLCGTFFESILMRENGKWIRKYWDIIGGR